MREDYKIVSGNHSGENINKKTYMQETTEEDAVVSCIFLNFILCMVRMEIAVYRKNTTAYRKVIAVYHRNPTVYRISVVKGFNACYCKHAS